MGQDGILRRVGNRLATRLLAVVRSPRGRLTIDRRLNTLPRIAASRKLRWDFSGIAPAAESGPINNRPQAGSLPHKIIAAREETNA